MVCISYLERCYPIVVPKAPYRYERRKLCQKQMKKLKKARSRALYSYRVAAQVKRDHGAFKAATSLLKENY